MITTVDGVTLLNGDESWVIGFDGKIFYPYPHEVHPDSRPDMYNIFHDKKLCQEQCNLMNQDNKI